MEDIIDIKPLIYIPHWWETPWGQYLLWGGGALLLTIILFFALRHYIKQRRQRRYVPPPTPWEAALACLSQLAGQNYPPKKTASIAVRTLHEYCEHAFGKSHTEQTSYDFLQELIAENRLPSNTLTQISDFLDRSELYRFAAASMHTNEHQAYCTEALDLLKSIHQYTERLKALAQTPVDL